MSQPAGATEPERVVMGRVSGPYGVRGAIRIEPWSESVSTLTGHPRWWMRKGGQWSLIVVERATVHGQQVVAQLEGCTDRDQALAWRGAEVALERPWLPPLAEGSYYWADLIGLAVRNEQGDDLGTVAEVFSNGAHEVLRVVESAAAGPVERLVPFVGAVVVTVSLTDRVVQVRWERDW